VDGGVAAAALRRGGAPGAEQAAAIDLVRQNKGVYLESRFRTTEASQALQQLTGFQGTLEEGLRKAIRAVYLETRQLAAMQDGIETGLAGLDAARAVDTVVAVPPRLQHAFSS